MSKQAADFEDFDADTFDAQGQADQAAETALLPGRTATYPNYTSYWHGINGIMIDVASPTSAPTVDDFEFRIGNDSDPGAWDVLGPDRQPDVTVRPGAGVDSSDRITLIWDDNTVEKQWMRVTVLAGGNIGLAEDDVFCFGNAFGETGNSAADAMVDEADRLLARNSPHTFLNPASVDDACDFNRDRKVNATDELIARDNTTTALTALKLITVPGGSPAAPAPLQGDIDRNNTVDAADMAVFWSTFGLRGDNLAADFNGDGRVNLTDFMTLRANFGKSLAQVPAAAEAPSASEPRAVPVPVAGAVSESAANLLVELPGIYIHDFPPIPIGQFDVSRGESSVADPAAVQSGPRLLHPVSGVPESPGSPQSDSGLEVDLLADLAPLAVSNTLTAASDSAYV